MTPILMLLMNYPLVPVLGCGRLDGCCSPDCGPIVLADAAAAKQDDGPSASGRPNNPRRGELG